MSNASFLPEDYLEQKAERRTNLISLTLFAIVMVAVFAAFLVTNRQWSQVRDAQREINLRYQEVAVDIERLNELEKQKEQMLSKAELAAALVERVPRSVLLWELINRMPARLGLVKVELKSELVRAPRPQDNRPRTIGGRPRRAQRAGVRNDTPQKIEPPRYKVRLSLTGQAPTDRDVSNFMSSLNHFKLLEDVHLLYTKEQLVDGNPVRQFEISMVLDPAVDARHLSPHTASGEGFDESMSNELRLNGGRDG